MINIINYNGHKFIFRYNGDSEFIKNINLYASTYGEFECENCKMHAAFKYVKYKWYYGIWKPLDISCNEVLIKELLE